MSDVEPLSFEGSEPERTWPRLNEYDLPSMTPEEQSRIKHQVLERLHATPAPRREPEGAAVAAVSASPPARVFAERQAGEEGATVRSPTFDERAVAAPPPAEPLAAWPPVQPWEPPPTVAPAPAALTTTTAPVEIPPELREFMGRPPFKPPTPGEGIGQTRKVPVMDWRQGKTEPLGDDFMKKVVAALPFPGNKVGAGIVSFPRLSLTQYASLRVDLSMWPEWSDEILRRYHVVNKAARRALEEHWQAQLAASPKMRAELDEAFATYTDWLRRHRE